tara:strand:- start:52 stop:351 length:300 start_codon:yes stop_codon:yes gene_type:complete
MKRARFTPTAESDLTDIAYFIARDNPAHAASFVDEIIRHCHDIADTPGVGRVRPDLAAGIHSLPHGRYLIFYRIVESGIEVARVLHGARDIPTLFEGEN